MNFKINNIPGNSVYIKTKPVGLVIQVSAGLMASSTHSLLRGFKE